MCGVILENYPRMTVANCDETCRKTDKHRAAFLGIEPDFQAHNPNGV
jgi:hypothetical protein